MPAIVKLREESRVYRHIARSENEPHLKMRLASHALALAQLAEKLERERAETPRRNEIGAT